VSIQLFYKQIKIKPTINRSQASGQMGAMKKKKKGEGVTKV
jgi:hypothetical protein